MQKLPGRQRSINLPLRRQQFVGRPKVYPKMALCAARVQLMRSSSSSCGAWTRLLQRWSSSSSIHSFNEKEIREKLQAFPGGSIDLLKQESGIAVLTINNPSRMNAFSGSMMVELEDRVSQLESWTDGKGVIVVGAAGTFCSGSDLNAVRAISNPQCRLPLISVAMVEGKALGGGAELTTACDFRLMAPGGVIQFVHKHMGLVPGWGGAARLVRIVGSQGAIKLLAGARKVDPELGLQIGLVNGVLDGSGGSALQGAEDWLGHYTKGAAPVIQAVKKVVVSGRELPLAEALRAEKEVFGTVWGAPANLQALASKHKHR
ncbi:ethylmalonyl-CoA decarboxylase isoform X2 [Nelusetta ayraudi]|uniref:ethylmalonyl-CoA decarboxylase isoform X2 n=1 Tax=Nelusetta ayraudi TaxID=303726 RepID=UPI003F7156DC